MTNALFVLVLIGVTFAVAAGVFGAERLFDVGMGVSFTGLIGMGILHAFNSNQKIK